MEPSMQNEEKAPILHMVLLLLSVLVCVTLVAGSFYAGSAQEKKQFMADRHQAKGLDCASCHTEKGPPKGPVTSATCLKCHGDEEKLAMKTSGVHPNPHDSHLGEVACDKCHHGHKPPEDGCGKCHNFGHNLR
jgi:hypothetical protein